MGKEKLELLLVRTVHQDSHDANINLSSSSLPFLVFVVAGPARSVNIEKEHYVIDVRSSYRYLIADKLLILV